MRALILVPLLAACGPPLPDVWTVSGEEPLGVEQAVQVALEQAPCDVTPWGGSIEFVQTRFSCGGVDARGCSWADEDGIPHVIVTAQPGADPTLTAIVHELGHVAFERCGLPHADHPIEFMAWISWTNMALLGRMREGEAATRATVIRL